MHISQRAQSITPFWPWSSANAYAAAFGSQGHRVIKLNLGEPDFGALPAVLAELQKVAQQALPYTGALGLRALRQAIAKFYATQHGVTLSPDRIVVTAGASAALLLVTAALVDPGDEVLVGDPSPPATANSSAASAPMCGWCPPMPPRAFSSTWPPCSPLERPHPGPDDCHALQPHRHLPCPGRAGRHLRMGAPARCVAHRGRDLPEPQRCRCRRSTGTTILASDPDAIVINSFSKVLRHDRLAPGLGRGARCPGTSHGTAGAELLHLRVHPGTDGRAGLLHPESLAVCSPPRRVLRPSGLGFARFGPGRPACAGFADGAFYVTWMSAQPGWMPCSSANAPCKKPMWP